MLSIGTKKGGEGAISVKTTLFRDLFSFFPTLPSMNQKI